MHELPSVTTDFPKTWQGRSSGKYIQVHRRDFGIYFQSRDMADFLLTKQTGAQTWQGRSSGKYIQVHRRDFGIYFQSRDMADFLLTKQTGAHDLNET